MVLSQLHRRSIYEVFFKEGVLQNFAKITGKHLCQSLFPGLNIFCSARRDCPVETMLRLVR